MFTSTGLKVVVSFFICTSASANHHNLFTKAWTMQGLAVFYWAIFPAISAQGITSTLDRGALGPPTIKVGQKVQFWVESQMRHHSNATYMKSFCCGPGRWIVNPWAFAQQSTTIMMLPLLLVPMSLQCRSNLDRIQSEQMMGWD